MPAIEERVAFLEGKVDEHSRAWTDLKDLIIHVEGKINVLDAKVDRRIDALDAKVETFRDQVVARIESLDQRLTGEIKGLSQEIKGQAGDMKDLDQKLTGEIKGLAGDMKDLDQKLTGEIRLIDQKLSKYFLWIVGIQVSMFLALIANFLKQ